MEELNDVWSGADTHPLVRFGVAAAIGFLIGLEREFAKKVRDRATDDGSSHEKQFAGLRTFTLIALLGFLSALSVASFGIWSYAIILTGFIALLVTSYVAHVRQGEIGATSEITSLITFLLGGLAVEGHLLFIVLVAVLVLLLLSFKLPLHRFVSMLTEQEIRAIIEFVIISVLVLPFLPNIGYGPHGTWNPKEIWTMVVLVSGISLAGYLLAKVLGAGRGTLLAGVVGGLVSSTAVALSFARAAKERTSARAALAMGILAASAIMFLRMLLELYLVNKDLALMMTLPLALTAAMGLGAAWHLKRSVNKEVTDEDPVLTNPLNFRVALQFAVLYALVRWVVVWSDERFGNAGTYVAGALAGLTDVDAVTLSMARMASEPGWDTQAQITILIAATVNTLVKFGIAAVVGGPVLRRTVTPGFAAMTVAAVAGMVWAVVG